MKKDGEEYLEYRRRLSRESQRKRREKASEAGMCVICCRNKTNGKRTCEACRKRIIEYNRRRYEL